MVSAGEGPVPGSAGSVKQQRSLVSPDAALALGTSLSLHSAAVAEVWLQQQSPALPLVCELVLFVPLWFDDETSLGFRLVLLQ